MPELPEVETVVRDLRAAGLVGRSIAGVQVHWPRSVHGASRPEFVRRVRGRRIDGIARRAKYILIELSGGETLLVHLRMTGQFRLEKSGALRDPHEHVVLELDDGRELRFHDTRKFGRWQLVADPRELDARLGPEPLDDAFTRAVLEQRLAGRQRRLKPLLLDQSVVAGLGNIYVDEVLWRSRLHPLRNAASLTRREQGALYRAIRNVLAIAVENRGTSLGDGATNFQSLGGGRGLHQAMVRVFRRDGQPCPRCGATIVRLIVGQRGTHICPCCQRVGAGEQA